MILSLILSSLLTFVQLNCENMFDCADDSLTQDSEYLPESGKYWTPGKYWKKLNSIGKEIIACGGDGDEWRLPDIVALCEIENDSVMRDLTKRSLLRKAGYEYVMTNSADVRGIDVALMYSPFSFKPLSHYSLRVERVRDMRPTRDILYVKGLIRGGDTLHVFVVHAPSRYGGKKNTERHRLQVAERLRMATDSIRSLYAEAKIIVSGDFNDESTDKSLREICGSGLFNISATAKGSNGAKGTYKYKGEWSRIDHILASGSMTQILKDCRINDAEFLLESDETYGGVQPMRTYNGYRYNGGYSDHLPIVARFGVDN